MAQLIKMVSNLKFLANHKTKLFIIVACSFFPFSTLSAEDLPPEKFLVVNSVKLEVFSNANGNFDYQADQITNTLRTLYVRAETFYNHESSENEPWWTMAHSITDGQAVFYAGSLTGTEHIWLRQHVYSRTGSDEISPALGEVYSKAEGSFTAYTGGEDKKALLEVSLSYNCGCDSHQEHCVGNYSFSGGDITISGPQGNLILNFPSCKEGCGVDLETKKQTILVSQGDSFSFSSSISGSTSIGGVLNGLMSTDIVLRDAKPSVPLGQPKDPNALVGKDPINVASGNVYSPHQDILIPTTGLPLQFLRTYNSQDSYQGALGYGWTHNYNLNLKENPDGSVVLMDEDGRRLSFNPLSAGTYQPPKGEYSQLTKNPDGAYLLVRKHNQKLYFNPQGLLERIEDRNNNYINILRDTDGTIQEVCDSFGRKLTFSYDTQKRITQIKDPANRIFKYEYDSFGNLNKTEGPLNNPTTYLYDGNHNLIQIIDANNHSIYFAYDQDGRAYRTWQDGNNNAVTLNFNPNNQTTTLTNSLGSATQYNYNYFGLITKITDSQNKTQSFNWDNNLNRITATDQNNNTIAFTYDERGNLLTTQDPLGHISSFTYEPSFDFLNSSTDSLGNKSEYLYDERGNLIQIKDALNNITTYTYNAQGQLIQIKDANNNITNFIYDSFGNLIQTVDALNNPTSFTYDILGNLLRTTDALGNPIDFTYDLLNRLTQTTYADNTKTTYNYDPVGNLLFSTDPNNRTTAYTYDAVNRLIKVTDALGSITQYTYDTEGNRLSIIDANSHQTQYFYDSLNRLIKTINPLNNQAAFTYDPVGNLISKTDANANTINYTYDSLGRLLKKQYPDSTEETFSYDARGDMLNCANPNISYNFNYNPLGKLIGVTDSNNRSLSYAYDSVGNRVNMVTPEAKTITYSYDPLNRLTAIKDTYAKTTSYTYDSLGRRTSVALPNIATASYQYDALSRLTSLINKAGNSSAISSYTYTYDNAGNRLTKLEPHSKLSYTYDALYRLIQSSYERFRGRADDYSQMDDADKDDEEWDCDKTPHKEHQAEAYTYDNLGNRLTSLRNTYSYNIANQLLNSKHYTYEYDSNASLTKKTEITEHGTPRTYTYSYDYENRLKQVTIQDNYETTTIFFTYDPLGRRIKKTIQKSDNFIKTRTITYVYDNEDIILEYISTSYPHHHHNQQEVIRFTHGPGIDEPISIERRNKLYYYHYDGLGSVTELTDHNRRVVERYDYDSFGNLKRYGNRTNNPYTYTSREFDSETGLYYYRNRYYDPKTGRFLTQDPLGTIDGPNLYTYVDSVGKPTSVDFNLYNFVGNNPINRIDPYGLWYIDINLSGGFWGGGTGGILIGPKGIYRYEGGGIISPKASVAIMWSPYNVVEGWNLGLQFVGGIAYQRSGSLVDKKNPDWEVGAGISFPTFWGASLAGYYVHEPWIWLWKRNSREKKSNCKK